MGLVFSKGAKMEDRAGMNCNPDQPLNMEYLEELKTLAVARSYEFPTPIKFKPN